MLEKVRKEGRKLKKIFLIMVQSGGRRDRRGKDLLRPSRLLRQITGVTISLFNRKMIDNVPLLIPRAELMAASLKKFVSSLCKGSRKKKLFS